MRFHLIDKVVELIPGQRISALKMVSSAEEYLADHFPSFPVLPGVLMLQALVEAASWLVLDGLSYKPTVVLLRSAKNITYKSFVKPGDALQLEVSCRRLGADDADFEGIGSCRQAEVLKGRFTLAFFELAGRMPGGSVNDERLRSAARARFGLLRA